MKFMRSSLELNGTWRGIEENLINTAITFIHAHCIPTDVATCIADMHICVLCKVIGSCSKSRSLCIPPIRHVRATVTRRSPALFLFYILFLLSVVFSSQVHLSRQRFGSSHSDIL